jgi:hypothetical protein
VQRVFEIGVALAPFASILQEILPSKPETDSVPWGASHLVQELEKYGAVHKGGPAGGRVFSTKPFRTEPFLDGVDAAESTLLFFENRLGAL